ncbi:hypothetical protein Ciccas_004650 [Cichlidogyrus casuarinus]|uniref:Diacylglycerol kinase accessory domain-containing protein n=1 Tax=Cichlidogyrus casuarinus TaxID=1844966 RepID=A0ABD2QB13_9PLAT
MFYVGVGGKDLLKRSWRNLSDHITLHCDNVDLTPRIRELRLHCLLFLNIPRYSAGTMPWGTPAYSMGFEPQRIDDGYLEVIGFTSTSLATLYVGGHGLRICQCRTAIVTTNKTVPMQVDGEPCRLKPSIIRIWRRNQARLVRKPKRRSSLSLSFDDSNLPAPLLPRETSISERIRVEISVVSMTDYEELGYDRELLQQACESCVFVH